MRSRWRLYIRPIGSGGATYDFSGANYTEVTNDVVWTSVSDVTQALDNTEFDVGIFRMQSFTFALLNYANKYSDPNTQSGVTNSIFYSHGARHYSQVKLTWEEADRGGPFAGVSTAGNSDFLSSEQTIFEGLIDDTASQFDPVTRTLSITALGIENIFSNQQPIPLSNSISSSVMLSMLNRSPASSVLTINTTNFTYKSASPIGDPGTDDTSSLTTMNGLDAIAAYLPSVNAVMYIRNYTVYITTRTPTANITFYLRGQGSVSGPENIMLIENVTFGLSKVYNYVQWSGTGPPVAKDNTSIGTFGCRTKTISYAWFTNVTNQTNIITSIKNEFYLPQIEMDVTTPLNVSSVAVNLLDQVYLDLPDLSTVKNATGTTSYYSQLSLGTRFKVISKAINVMNSTIKFHLRAY